MNPLFRMKELIELINDADKAYFGKDEPIMTDKEYDDLVAELTGLEKTTGVRFKNSPTGRVSGEVKEELKKVEHTKPMLSCDKTKSIEDIIEFASKGDILLSWKMDGLTLVLRYEGGEFKQAITRGANGLVGEDVTHTVTHFRNIPYRVAEKGSFEVRGEGVISWEDHKILTRLGEKFTHPRSLASGAVRSIIPDRGKLAHLDFFAFELIKDKAPATKKEQLKLLRDNNFDVVEHKLIEKDIPKEEKESAITSFTPENFAYPVDGLVAEYDDIAYGKRLGATAHHEKRMLALKWNDEVKMTVFRGVDLRTTRNGTVSIIGLFDEVEIDGTRVHRANLHNLGNFERYSFGVGDMISVYKANMIIPQIADNLTRSGGYELPKYCPSCGQELTVRVSVGGVRELYCPNTECVARNAQHIARYCDKNAMNIDGLSASTLEKMIAYGWVKSYKDLYNLKVHQDSITSTPGFGAERYNALIEEIEKSRSCYMRQFLVGIGIPQLGPEAARVLHQYYYGSMADFEKAMKEGFNFSHIAGITPALERNIHEWYENDFNRKTLHALMAELDFKAAIKPASGNDNPFYNRNVVVSGSFDSFTRNDITELLISLGAHIESEVTMSTDYLIYGAMPGSKKVAYSIEYKVIMLSEQKFTEMLGQNL